MQIHENIETLSFMIFFSSVSDKRPSNVALMEWGESTSGYAISAGKLEIIAHSTNARYFLSIWTGSICSWNMIHHLPLAYLHADAAVTGISTNPSLNPAWVLSLSLIICYV